MPPRLSLPCPCCGFPTLQERGAWEICSICWWEDDGQDDPRTDEVRGGPNGEYSLSAARANFRQHGDMYDRGKGIEAVEQPSPERGALMTYVRNVLDGEAFDRDKLNALIEADTKARRARG
jgi:hypothetical protein